MAKRFRTFTRRELAALLISTLTVVLSWIAMLVILREAKDKEVLLLGLLLVPMVGATVTVRAILREQRARR